MKPAETLKNPRNGSDLWENESGPRGAGNTAEGLTHSLDLGKEGLPMNGTRKTTPAHTRFWSKVDASGDCWTWTGSKKSSDYGGFFYDGRVGYAHRFSYALHFGEIPDGATIDHLCRNKSCVNPSHLEAVTQLQNNRRRTQGEGSRGQVISTCDRGHEKTPDNVYRHGTDYHCMKCRAINAAERLARKRDEINAKRRARYAVRKDEINAHRRAKAWEPAP